MLPDTEYAIKTAINVGIIICNWPVISNTTTAVEMVCVAPDAKDAAPTTAYAPGNTLSSTLEQPKQKQRALLRTRVTVST